MARMTFVRAHPIATTVLAALVITIVLLVALGVVGGRGGEDTGESLVMVVW